MLQKQKTQKECLQHLNKAATLKQCFFSFETKTFKIHFKKKVATTFHPKRSIWTKLMHRYGNNIFPITHPTPTIYHFSRLEDLKKKKKKKKNLICGELCCELGAIFRL